VYVERIKYQTYREGEWNTGCYIGRDYNCEDSAFLDKNYKPIIGSIWDYRSDFENRIIFSINEKEE